MTNITERYLQTLARLTLALALFLCGTTVCPSMRSLPGLEDAATPSCSRNIAVNEFAHIKHWLIEKYTNVRFVYRVEMQVSQLYAAETERERKQAGKHS